MILRYAFFMLLRFGKIMKICPCDSSSDLLVEFATRRDAERAMRKAGIFQGQSLSLSWKEDLHPPVTAPAIAADGGGDGESAESTIAPVASGG